MGNNFEEVEVIQQPNKLQLFQQDKAAIDVQVATAKMYPRNVRQCVTNAITVATLSTETAKGCMYTVPRGAKSITGPSVHLAKIVVQTWGNLRVQTKVVDIDLKHVTSQSICWDLESNVAVQVEVKRLIVGKEGRFSDDMITVTGNAANSISLRNAVFATIPKDVVDKIYNAAIEKIIGKLSDKNQLIIKRKEVVDGLKQVYNVTEQEILQSIGKNSIDTLTKEDIAVLTGIGTALRDGDTTVDEAFRGKKIQEKSAESAKMDRLIALIKDAKTIEQLEKLKRYVNNSVVSKIYDDAYAELISKK